MRPSQTVGNPVLDQNRLTPPSHIITSQPEFSSCLDQNQLSNTLTIASPSASPSYISYYTRPGFFSDQATFVADSALAVFSALSWYMSSGAVGVFPCAYGYICVPWEGCFIAAPASAGSDFLFGILTTTPIPCNNALVLNNLEELVSHSEWGQTGFLAGVTQGRNDQEYSLIFPVGHMMGLHLTDERYEVTILVGILRDILSILSSPFCI